MQIRPRTALAAAGLIALALGAIAEAAPTNLVPAGAIPGWEADGEPSHFPAEDLWRQINGAADQFLAYGCQSLSVAYYRSQASVAPDGAGDVAGEADAAGVVDAEITAQIYRMGDERGAFGIYALERPPAGPFLSIAAQGYQTGADLNFFGGCYYVKLSAYPDDEVQRAAVRRLAERIAETYLAGSSFPPELDYFPRQGLVPASCGLVPRSVLGLAELNNAFVAKYAIPGAGTGEHLTLHLIIESDPRAAGAISHQAIESLAKRATGPREEVLIGEAQGVRIDVRYRGPVFLLRQRQFIIVACGAEDSLKPGWTEELITALLTNLPH